MSVIITAALVTFGILGALLTIGAVSLALLTATNHLGRSRPAHWLRARASIRRHRRTLNADTSTDTDTWHSVTGRHG